MQRYLRLNALAIAGALAFAAPAASAQISGGGVSVDPIEELAQIEELMRSEFDGLAVVIQNSQDVTPILDRVRVQIDTWETIASENPGSACAVHARLVRHLDYLAELATRAQLGLRDVQQMHEHTLETLVDWHVATAIRRAQNAGVASAPLKRAVQLLLERADQAAGTPIERVLRDRYARRFAALVDRAQQAVVDMQATRVELLEVRLGLAIERLREAIRDRGGSRELFEQIVDLWKDRARAALGQDFPVCGA